MAGMPQDCESAAPRWTLDGARSVNDAEAKAGFPHVTPKVTQSEAAPFPAMVSPIPIALCIE